MTTTPATPTAGTPGPSTPAAGSPAVGGAGAGGATGTSTSGVSTAGTSAAASGSGGTSTAVAGAAAGGAGAAATGGSAAAGKGGSGAAGTTAAAGGCGSESFAAIYESILKNTTYNCAGPLCHGRETAMAMPVGNLSLSTADVAYMQLVKVDSTGMACSGMPRVVPGNPEGSLLVQKLRSSTTTCGGVMPVGADEISEADLKRVTDWISGGACDN
jgi:hypothetical protein